MLLPVRQCSSLKNTTCSTLLPPVIWQQQGFPNALQRHCEKALNHTLLNPTRWKAKQNKTTKNPSHCPRRNKHNVHRGSEDSQLCSDLWMKAGDLTAKELWLMRQYCATFLFGDTKKNWWSIWPALGDVPSQLSKEPQNPFFLLAEKPCFLLAYMTCTLENQTFCF